MNFNEAVANYKADPSNANLSQQVDRLLLEMTLKEKAGLLAGRWWLTIRAALKGLLRPRGSIFYFPFYGGGCRRLKIPRVAFSDGGRGLTGPNYTCFPVPVARAATFDPELESEVGQVFAVEGRLKGVNMFGGICINVLRNPRWGRAQEGYGEDPFLIGVMAERLVAAVQASGIIAMPKHFALNSIENLRFVVSAEADERTLHEVYFPHFKRCIDAGAWSIMSAYNKVNGEYCGESRYLLNDVLREQWGFDGLVGSDFVWGVHDTAGSLNAGCDLEMPVPRYHNYRAIRKAIKAGTLSEATVDVSAARVLRSYLRAYAAMKDYDPSLRKCRTHYDIAEKAAVEGITLLKNNGVLPLDKSGAVAVVGPYADTINVGDAGSSSVTARDTITPYAGMRERFATVTASSGLSVPRALKAAEGTGAVVVCVGCDRRDEGEALANVRENTTREKATVRMGGDRESLHLKPDEVALIRAVKEAGKKVIVVLTAGSVVLTEDFEESADAIVLAYYAGVRGGRALARLLSGEANFSGKLPVTVAKSEDDYPRFHEIGEKPYVCQYGYYHGYTLLDRGAKEPRYPFGFGLSYTTFELTDHRLHQSDDGVTVSCSVTNTGEVQGAEVVQVYVGSTHRTDDRPVKTLKGFQRVELEAGETKEVAILINPDDLRFYDSESKHWALDPVYRVWVGTSSRDVQELASPLKFS